MSKRGARVGSRELRSRELGERKEKNESIGKNIISINENKDTRGLMKNKIIGHP